MNGPEHYRAAENLLVGYPEVDTESPEALQCIARAQVHAVLAQIALTVDACDAAGALTVEARHEWVRAVGREVTS